tara:strand:+ start:6837 stop:7883 length:1047 start_codon:yes stop_codon:yes gene_type:complete
MNANDMSNQFALDVGGFQRLQHTARVDPEAGVNGAAQQFEALFIQMMMKSMREAIPSSGLMDSSATNTYQSMLDQQWSQVMASRGMGLADVLVEQLERQGAISKTPAGTNPDRELQALIAGIPRGTPRVLDDAFIADSRGNEDMNANGGGRFLAELEAIRQGVEATPVEAGARPDGAVTQQARRRADHVDHFIQTLTAPAQAASANTGVPAELILAQAALETGWGRHEITTRSGANSYNVFGIKAGSQWEGKTTDIVTHEYINGRRTQVVDTFRVYDSFEHAFTDYAGLIGNNPRYAGVLQAASAEQAAQELQRGGYATDPLYADKLVAVMNTMGAASDSGNFLADSR